MCVSKVETEAEKQVSRELNDRFTPRNKHQSNLVSPGPARLLIAVHVYNRFSKQKVPR